MESQGDKGEPSAMANPPLPPKMLPMSRKGFGTRGQTMQLLTNHFRVYVRGTHGHFLHYHVVVKYEDGHPVEAKGLCRRVVDKLQETYGASELAYDGEKSLFTAGALPQTNSQFVVVTEDASSARGCLLVRQSFFLNNPSKFINLGGCAMGSLSLNVDVSTIVRPGRVIDFLLFNQNINDPHKIDWGKAKRALKNLRIKTTNNSEFRINGSSEDTCYLQTFQMKRKNGNSGSDTVEVIVFEYYRNNWKIDLKQSAHFPCLNVGKPKHPTYIPLEAKRVQRWVVVNFSARCHVRYLVQHLIHCGNVKGLQVDPEDHVFQEKSHMRHERAATRVNDMFQQLLSGNKPSFVLCVLPERKNCDIYDHGSINVSWNTVLSAMLGSYQDH